jgi:hypothetical protein
MTPSSATSPISSSHITSTYETPMKPPRLPSSVSTGHKLSAHDKIMVKFVLLIPFLGLGLLYGAICVADYLYKIRVRTIQKRPDFRSMEIARRREEERRRKEKDRRRREREEQLNYENYP